MSVYEDNFEQETKAEADQYAALQRNEKYRGRTRAENKRRRKEGLEPLKLPPAIRSSRKRELEDTSHLNGTGNSDAWAQTRGGIRKKTRGGNEEDLDYEGRRC